MPTTILGLDGADWKIIAPLCERGDLPVLRGLIERGCHGTLLSTVPPNSPPAWASMITGVNPGKHNIFDFAYIDETYRKVPVDAMSRIAASPLWRIMNRFGMSTGMVNIPIHYPAEPVNGFIICGLVTPWSAEVFTYPPEISREIGNPSDQWLIGQTLVRGGSPEEFLKEIKEKTRRQADWIIRLQKKYQPDFLMMVFDGTDKLQHFFWKYWDASHSRHDAGAHKILKEAIPDYYRFVDACLGEILETRRGTDVFVVSDHGFTGMERDIFIEKWLVDEGYLYLKNAPAPASNQVRNKGRSAWNALANNGTLKAALKGNRLSRWILEKIKGRIVDADDRAQLNRNVDWSKTSVFFAGVSSQSLQVNLQGREKFGIVAPQDYEALVREVTAKLAALCDLQTGSPLVQAAHEKNELYHGPWAAHSPDIVVLTADRYSLQEGFPNRLVMPASLFGADRSGGHRPQGIFIVSGPNVQPHAPALEAHITDIMPTVLHLSGLPIPDYVDGNVLTGVIRTEFMQANPVRVTDEIQIAAPQAGTLTPEERELLESHLRALGYF